MRTFFRSTNTLVVSGQTNIFIVCVVPECSNSVGPSINFGTDVDFATKFG